MYHIVGNLLSWLICVGCSKVPSHLDIIKCSQSSVKVHDKINYRMCLNAVMINKGGFAGKVIVIL